MQGEMGGKTVVFSGNLPGLPDNISPSHDRDGYFVGVGATRFSKVLDYFAKHPTWRSVIAKVCPHLHYVYAWLSGLSLILAQFLVRHCGEVLQRAATQHTSI